MKTESGGHASGADAGSAVITAPTAPAAPRRIEECVPVETFAPDGQEQIAAGQRARVD